MITANNSAAPMSVRTVPACCAVLMAATLAAFARRKASGSGVSAPASRRNHMDSRSTSGRRR